MRVCLRAFTHVSQCACRVGVLRPSGMNRIKVVRLPGWQRLAIKNASPTVAFSKCPSRNVNVSAEHKESFMAEGKRIQIVVNTLAQGQEQRIQFEEIPSILIDTRQMSRSNASLGGLLSEPTPALHSAHLTSTIDCETSPDCSRLSDKQFHSLVSLCVLSFCLLEINVSFYFFWGWGGVGSPRSDSSQAVMVVRTGCMDTW